MPLKSNWVQLDTIHDISGRGSGSFIGGNLIGKVGIRHAFRIMGLVAIIAGIIYGMLHYYWLSKTEYALKEDEEGLGNY